MAELSSDADRRGISVVIPSFNSAPWLPATLRALDAAIQAADDVAVQVLVVDDGSTDNTAEVIAAVTPSLSHPVEVVRTENQGRFLARWTGVQASQHPEILLLDSRVLLAEGSLRHLLEVRDRGEGAGPWNAHADTSPNSRLLGLFWEVPTFLFWGDYRSNPRPMQITPDNFDRLPKGTTCFLVSRTLYEEACRACWPSANAHLISDDTMVLRHIADQAPIRIDPAFRVDYVPRQSLRGFLSHSFVRGTLFVSSYAGTSRLRDLVLLTLALCVPLTIAVLVAAAALHVLLPAVLAIALLFALALTVPTLVALRRHCSRRAALAFVCYIVPFGAVFWAGLCRGLVVHRHLWLTGS